MQHLTKVLVANRGEIAIRIFATLRQLGIRSVAIYSDGDSDALHVQAADEAIRVGPAEPSQSYLDVAAVVAAARSVGADGLHPGYGFLSENPELPQECQAADITFIGPSAAAMQLMGDKAAAKQAARDAGVPVLPGVDSVATVGELEGAIAQVGVPLILKPTAGGGGKGMTVIESPDANLAELLASSQRVAQAAFGDDRLVAERYIPSPRHIEIQVLADKFGDAIHLGERECSLQRRHQKVIEEAPSPYVTPTLREEMGAAALRLVQAADYSGVGTIEYIVDPESGDFFFLEMNTRLQVEHPVTELVTGIDLVRQQVLVASGYPLPITQADVDLCGHAIEARVYAEDPAEGFLPSAGRVPYVVYPEQSEWVRVDAGVMSGSTISASYDPLVAKICGWGESRRDALRHLDLALSQTRILGVATNVSYLRSLLAADAVQQGNLDTHFLDNFPTTPAPAIGLGAVAAVCAAQNSPLGVGGGDAPLWRTQTGWRTGGNYRTTIDLSGDNACVWEVAADGQDGNWATQHVVDSSAAVTQTNQITVAVRLDDVRTRNGDRVLTGSYVEAGQRFDFAAAIVADHLWVVGSAGRFDCSLALRGGAGNAGSADSGDDVVSPLPGQVTNVSAGVGDDVQEGDYLLTVEAMKMEHKVTAHKAGRIGKVLVAVGDAVGRKALLVQIEEDNQ